MSFKLVVRKNWQYIVVSLALLVGIALLSQNVFASMGASKIYAAVPANHTLPGVYDHTQQLAGGAMTDTDTPTSTSTPTDSVTPSPAMLVGHVSRCCSNNVQPISLTLTMGGTQIDYPIQNTDANGYFTVSVEGLPSGTYNWRAKDPKFLAKSGTVTLTGAPITQLEIGSLVGGDANNDNVVDAIDFSIMRANFGRSCGDPLFDARADFNNDCIVNETDHNIFGVSNGSLGAPPDSPAPPSSGDAFVSLQPGSGGNCASPANGGTVQVGCRFVLDMMVNMGSVPNGVAMQSYMTFTSSILPNARVSSIATSCVPTSTVAVDSTIFDAGMQNEVCNGPAQCTFRGIRVDAGWFAYGRGALSHPPSGGTFRVAQTGWCAIAPGRAVLHWQYSPSAPRNRNTAIIDVNSNLVQGQSLFSDYVIDVVAVPSPTPTPYPRLVGHVTIEGRPAQPNALQSVPITFTLKVSGGGPENNYSANTDASGFFTITSPGPGLYNWRIKNPQTLASSGSVTLPSSGPTQQEMGLQREGDANNDNCTSALDFTLVKNSFGKGVGEPGYDPRADFNGDDTVSVVDFHLLKGSFGQCGVGPIHSPY